MSCRRLEYVPVCQNSTVMNEWLRVSKLPRCCPICRLWNWIVIFQIDIVLVEWKISSFGGRWWPSRLNCAFQTIRSGVVWDEIVAICNFVHQHNQPDNKYTYTKIPTIMEFVCVQCACGQIPIQLAHAKLW